MTPILETRRLNKRFGGLQVAADVDFSLAPGELHCLIGPNGAGKSTLFRLILGEYAPTSGQIFYDGNDITRLEPHDRIRRGISVKFQVPGIFKALSVAQNLEIALQHHLEGLSLRDEVEQRLDFLNLTSEADQAAGNLSHGQKQWLEIGMATSLKPKLLLLDEPTAGMGDEETNHMTDLIHRLNKGRGITILFVEHDMAIVFGIADRITVLDNGTMLAEGTADEISANPRVQSAYLGNALEETDT